MVGKLWEGMRVHIQVSEFCKVELKDGRCVCVIEIMEPGVAYLAEEPTPQREHAYHDFFITHREIAKLLPDDYKLPNPYK